MFSKVLIANRGEIACRVAATCRRLGIASVAVYSEADRDAAHVAACDEAVAIGPAPAVESYLDYARIIAAARATGAEAIHPGYGFLSENEAFAEACGAAGIVFIGPPVTAIAAMGSKAAAKRLMARAGVPLVPGYHDTDQDPERLRREADAIGYPVLIKASAGGGGKGMRVVERSEDFAAALSGCQREARASFGDDRVLIEKYLLRPRHVEVQVFADRHGAAVWLFDRDCSVQRRHQKVLEEAPAPGLDEAMRRAMGEAAVAAARAVNYEGAGTVEFIVAPEGAFYFMEMNTRLQVEHPVTELVTGLDLVEWQLRVAAGEPLPLSQTQLRLSGHAIEARLYAEDPARGFLPSTGLLRHLRLPAAAAFTQPGSAGVRVDSGVREGDRISPHYDPMIAKLIVHGENREVARARLARALAAVEIVGPHTNVAFLQRLVNSAPFRSADLDTGLIAREHDSLFAPAPDCPPAILGLACAALLEEERRGLDDGSGSPWRTLNGWRLNAATTRDWRWQVLDAGGDETRPSERHVIYRRDAQGERLSIDGVAHRFVWRVADDGAVEVELDQTRASGRVVRGEPADFEVFAAGERRTLHLPMLLPPRENEEASAGRLTAPMPGKVVTWLVETGQTVEKGTPLLVLEAMKMEHTIEAPGPGVVAALHYAVGDQVEDGAALLVLDAREEAVGA